MVTPLVLPVIYCGAEVVVLRSWPRCGPWCTGYKKDSIFAVGEGVGAKVGVTGSGRGLTQYTKQRKVGPGGVGSEDGE